MVFSDNERNKNLRESILKYFISSVMTDDERARLLNLPEGCRIRENAKIISPENFTCGEYVWIGEGAILDASGGLEIGAHTSIGLYVLIWSHTSYLGNVTLNNIIHSPLIERKKTTIGKGCFIAGHSVIYPGVTIGDKVVVLPMSTVSKDIPSNCIVSGTPPNQTINELPEDIIEKRVRQVLKKQKK